MKDYNLWKMLQNFAFMLFNFEVPIKVEFIGKLFNQRCGGFIDKCILN